MESFVFNGTTFVEKSHVEPHSCSYENGNNDTALLTPRNASISTDNCTYTGTINIGHETLSVEPCNTNRHIRDFFIDTPENLTCCHILTQMNVTKLDEEPDDSKFYPNKTYAPYLSNITDRNIPYDTVITYTVFFYYTPQFAAVTPDIMGWIEDVIADTNEGYNNSMIPLKAKYFCHRQIQIQEQDVSGYTVLDKFENLGEAMGRGDGATNLRGSADIAVLLVVEFELCGKAYGIGSIAEGKALCVVKKSCAIAQHSFGHEIAHLMGANHNHDPTADSTTTPYPWASGHLIASGPNDVGLRTIMSYSKDGHEKRVNYYSNPNVIHPITGTPTGLLGISNVALLITQAAPTDFLSHLGDESGTCDPTPSMCH